MGDGEGIANIDEALEEVVLDDGDSDGENVGVEVLHDYEKDNEEENVNLAPATSL